MILPMNLEKLEEICMNLAGTTQDIKWEDDLCFLIGEKMYCTANLTMPTMISFKVPSEEFDDLISRVGIFPASYLARYHWVTVKDLSVFGEKEWQHYISQSYDLVYSKLSKKMKKAISEKHQ